MPRRLGNDRSSIGRPLGAFGLRVRLQRQQLTVGAKDLVLVEMTGAQARDEQLPEPAEFRIGIRRPSHPLKSPTTLTRCAFGAHTAKATPSTPSWTTGCAPSLR